MSFCNSICRYISSAFHSVGATSYSANNYLKSKFSSSLSEEEEGTFEYICTKLRAIWNYCFHSPKKLETNNLLDKELHIKEKYSAPPFFDYYYSEKTSIEYRSETSAYPLNQNTPPTELDTDDFLDDENILDEGYAAPNIGLAHDPADYPNSPQALENIPK